MSACWEHWPSGRWLPTVALPFSPIEAAVALSVLMTLSSYTNWDSPSFSKPLSPSCSLSLLSIFWHYSLSICNSSCEGSRRVRDPLLLPSLSIWLQSKEVRHRMGILPLIKLFLSVWTEVPGFIDTTNSALPLLGCLDILLRWDYLSVTRSGSTDQNVFMINSCRTVIPFFSFIWSLCSTLASSL